MNFYMVLFFYILNDQCGYGGYLSCFGGESLETPSVGVSVSLTLRIAEPRVEQSLVGGFNLPPGKLTVRY